MCPIIVVVLSGKQVNTMTVVESANLMKLLPCGVRLGPRYPMLIGCQELELELELEVD